MDEVNLRSDRALAIAFTGIKGFVRRNPFIAGFYVLGLILAIFAGGFQVDPMSMASFEQTISGINRETLREITSLAEKLTRAERMYRQQKGWFTCDEKCMVYYEQTQRLKLSLEQAKERRDSLQMEAKRQVGAWSIYGISDIRNAFWEAWEQGKEAARRMTMFDAIFMTLGSLGGYNNRDDSFILTIFQLLMQYILNLTIGLVSSLVFFIIESWYIITSYGPPILSGLSLFFLVVCSSAAVVLTAVGGMFGGLIGSVYFLVRNAEKRARLEGSSSRMRAPRMHWE